MANKEIKKYPVDKTTFLAVLHTRECSISKLGEEYDTIQRTTGTIRKYLDSGEMSIELLKTISDYLDVAPDILAGVNHRNVSACEKSDYFSYFESMLKAHDIALEDFKALPINRQIDFYHEINTAVSKVIDKYFKEGNTHE